MDDETGKAEGARPGAEFTAKAQRGMTVLECSSAELESREAEEAQGHREDWGRSQMSDVRREEGGVPDGGRPAVGKGCSAGIVGWK
jgi:hypothetical protein